MKILMRNVAFSVAWQFALLIFSLVVARLVFKQLGPEVLGVINISITISALLIAILDVGISITVAREVAAYKNRDMSYVREIVSTYATVGWGFFLLGALAIAIASDKLATGWLNLSHLDPQRVKMAVAVISTALLLALPRSIYVACLNGFEKTARTSAFNAGITAIQQLGMMAVLAAGGAIDLMVAWYAAWSVLALIPFMVGARALLGPRGLRLGYRHSIIKAHMKGNLALVANALANYANAQLDRWAIGALLPLSMLGFYGTAQGVVGKMAVLPGTIAGAAFPTFAANFGDGDIEGWRRHYHLLHELACWLLMPVAAIATIGAIGAMLLVFHAEVAKDLWVAILFMGLGQLLSGAMYIPTWLAMAVKRMDLVLRTSLSALLVVPLATIGLTVAFGVTGAALGSVVLGIWQWLFFVPRFSRCCLDKPAIHWYWHAGKYVGLGLAVYGIAWISILRMQAPTSIEPLLLIAGVGTIGYGALTWFFIPDVLRAWIKAQLWRALRAGQFGAKAK